MTIFTSVILVTALEDYSASSFQVTFFPDSSISRSLCVKISISSDGDLEDTEEFVIYINSSDSSVLVTQPNVSVDIVDSNG